MHMICARIYNLFKAKLKIYPENSFKMKKVDKKINHVSAKRQNFETDTGTERVQIDLAVILDVSSNANLAL